MTELRKFFTLALAVMLPLGSQAQTLSLHECRDMAIQNNKDIQQYQTKVEMAGYDRKIAQANYYPKISAVGAYMHNTRNLSLMPEDAASAIGNIGTSAQAYKDNLVSTLSQLLSGSETVAQYLQAYPELLQVIQSASQADIATSLNQMGSQINDAFNIDIHNIYGGVISVQQPVFVGGKVIAANKMAALAEELAKSQYDMQYQDLLVNVDKAYWQIVSVANKKKLAENYAELLHNMERDVDLAVKEGVKTESDALQVRVKANEADMLKIKADNGLVLAKMLLCKEIGLPLDSDITLVDETLEEIPEPRDIEEKTLDEIYRDRPETRSLDLAGQIYDQKYLMTRADMMPQVALMGNYIVTNPNLYHGITNEFGGQFNFGVMVKVPIFHGFEALNKTRKAKAEATLYRLQLDDAKDLIDLQVTQLRKQKDEAYERLRTAKANLDNAEENRRTALIGLEEGVIPANTALAAQTAWLQAHSDYIDAGIDLQMNNVNLQKALGNYRKLYDVQTVE